MIYCERVPFLRHEHFYQFYNISEKNHTTIKLHLKQAFRSVYRHELETILDH